MGTQVCAGAVLVCSAGLSPSTLLLPGQRPLAGAPAATVADHVPRLHVQPFGLCTSVQNPAVIAATAAAEGRRTPVPCVPATPAPWLPGSARVSMGGPPALTACCTLRCAWAGVIRVVLPGQWTTEVG